MAVLMMPDGTAKVVRPKNGTDFQNDEIHELIGDYWEVVRPMVLGTALIASGDQTITVDIVRGSMLICDEEGKLKNLPQNQLATTLYCNPPDYIVGPALLCGPGEIV